MAKNSKAVRVEDNNHRQLKWLARTNKLGLSLAKLANLCIDRGLPAVIKEVGK